MLQLCLRSAVMAVVFAHAATAQVYQPPITLDAGTDPAAIETADFNGDGNLDLIVVNRPSSPTTTRAPGTT